MHRQNTARAGKGLRVTVDQSWFTNNNKRRRNKLARLARRKTRHA